MNSTLDIPAIPRPGRQPPPPPPPPNEAEDEAEDDLSYDGGAWRLFRLVFNATLLTVLTLGIYRFWMITRMRRHYWSSIRLLGERLEYTGTPGEKFLGFLVAAVVLAVYLGLVNLALAYFGISAFRGNPLAANLSLLSALPLIYYASYRARRYLMARTRWRGIRLGMDKGAWRYALKALLLYGVAAASLGLLTPMAQFLLTKHVNDRCHFGDLRISQGGRWLALLPAWLPVWGAGLAAVGFFYVNTTPLIDRASRAQADGADIPPGDVAALMGSMAVMAGLALTVMLFLALYSARKTRYVLANLSIGPEAGLTSTLNARSLLWIYLRAGFGFALAVGALAIMVTALVWAALSMAGDHQASGDAVKPLVVTASIALYVVILAVMSALSQTLIQQPRLRLIVATAGMTGAGALAGAQQRDRDEAIEAGGFADALDVGAAF